MIAKSGRPGPVLIDVPKDISAQYCEYEYKKPLPPKACKPNEDEIKAACRLISECERPFIFAGGGVISSDACGQLYQLAKKINSPVSCSLMGLGAYPAHDDLLRACSACTEQRRQITPR
jgi:acetolactate synthase-1/2/3 large subunit